MKKFLIFFCVLILPFMFVYANVTVNPTQVGETTTDSVRINFGTTDTAYYPVVANADSFKVLIYPPDNAAPESLADNSSGVFNLTDGYYQVHKRGANSAGDLGIYTVCVVAYKGGAARGIGVTSYYVDAAGTYGYDLQDSSRDAAVAVQETVVAHAPHDNNWGMPDSVTVDESNLWGLGVEVNTKTDFSLASSQTFDNTGDWTGNLSGSVGSVTGAVGSVTGSVGGNVDGSVASVTADVGITQAGADKVWTTTTRALTDKAGFALEQDGLGLDTNFTNLQTVAAGIKSQTDNLPPDPCDDGDVDAQLATIDGNVDNIVLYTDGDGSDGIDADIGGDLIDDNPWNNALTDTGSGMGDWFAGWFNADYWLTGLTSAEQETLFNIRDYAHAAQESITAHAPHGDDWASVGAGGADLSDEVDSLLAVLYDRTNDSNFVRLMAHLLLHDSVTIDNSNAWDLSGGGDLSNEVDSLLAVLYDRTNDSNFVRLIAHLILHDSITIDKSNAWGLGVEVNTKTGFSLASSQTFNNTGTWTGNFTGSVGSLGTQAKADVEAECGDALTSYDPPTRAEATTDKNAVITEVDANETLINGIDDNQWDNAKSDTTSGIADWFADWFKMDIWLQGLTTAQQESLFNIRDYAHAVQGTINVHAPHGDNWATAGSGDTTKMKTMMQNNWDDDTDGLLSVEAGAGGADTNDIKALMQGNWDPDTDGEFSIEAATGAGEFSCTVFVKLDADSSAVPDIHVIVKNADQTVVLTHGYTNPNGRTILPLDSMATGLTHKFWIMDVEYTFTFPESVDVNTDTTLTFYGAAFDYGDPPAGNLCVVYDQIFDIELDSLSGVIITVELYVPADSILRYDGFPVSPYQKSYTTGVNGRWRFDLIPNSDPKLLPANTQAIFKFKYPEDGKYFIYEDTTEIPDQVSARYRDISGKM